MMDGFRKDWVVNFLERKETLEQLQAEARGRSDVLAGRTPVDEEFFAFSIPKICYYASKIDESEPPMEFIRGLMDGEEAGFAGWGMDVHLKDSLEGGEEYYTPPETSDTILDEPDEKEDTEDGYFSMVGKIVESFEEWQNDRKAM